MLPREHVNDRLNFAPQRKPKPRRRTAFNLVVLGFVTGSVFLLGTAWNLSRSRKLRILSESVFQTALADTFSPAKLQLLSSKLVTVFRENTPFPHVVIDDFIDPKLIKLVQEEIKGQKYEETCAKAYAKTKDKFSTQDFVCFYKDAVDEENESKKMQVHAERYMGIYTRFLFLLLKSSAFTSFLEDLSGIKDLMPDPHFLGSGIHSTSRKGFLRVHADFNRYARYKLDRRLNVFLFLNPDWQEEWGGALELWPMNMSRCESRILPMANRLVIFRTTDFSYHGYTDPIQSPFPRRSLAMYYYSNGRPVSEKHVGSHTTLWQDVPCQMQTLSSLAPRCATKTARL